MSVDTSVTELLGAWKRGEPAAFDRLLPRVLDELQGLARHYLAGERAGHTLQPTALVNEVYLRLAGPPVQAFANRSQFFAFAARLMRQILVDHARGKRRAKRGGTASRVPLEGVLDLSAATVDEETILAVDAALARLEEVSPRQHRVVELRYFVGLTVPEVAEAMGLGRATVERDWAVARRWLAREIGRSYSAAAASEPPGAAAGASPLR